MTIQLHNLSITYTVKHNGHHGRAYEISSVTNEADHPVPCSLELLEEIEEAIEHEMTVQEWEEWARDCEVANRMHIWF